MKAAQENKSAALVNKIVKAQAHNEKVRANALRNKEYYAAIEETEPQNFEQWAPNNNLLHKKLHMEERQMKAAVRKDYHLANRIQHTQEMQEKFFMPKEVKEAMKINNMINRMQQKLERAEALRNQQKEAKIKKAKDAQEKFLIREIADKKRKIRSQSQAVVNDNKQENNQGSLSNRSAEKPKAVAFYIDMEKSAQRWRQIKSW